MKAALNLIKKGISNLVCIGGDGSLTGANLFRHEWESYLEELLKNGLCCDMKLNLIICNSFNYNIPCNLFNYNITYKNSTK